VRLYSYWRSSTAYRVRIALEIKGIPYTIKTVSLVHNGGENFKPDYLAINPQGRVPALMLDSNEVLLQSPAILEYLEERYPTPPLLPSNYEERAHVRALCAIVACDIHPLNNVSALRRLREKGYTEPDLQSWIGAWISDGFQTLEQLVDDTGYCYGNSLSLADICLVPQIYNARRFNISLTPFPRLQKIEQHCLEIPAFQRAKPEAQPDSIT